MILCRKPCAIYDVDVIGFAALIVIALAAGFGVAYPASANTAEYRALSAEIAAAEAKMEQTNERLRLVNTEIDMLQSGVIDRTRAAPKTDALTPFLQRVASLAIECNLQITQVLPQPARQADGYLTGDIEFSGRGTSLSFARLLDLLSREIPYYSLQEFSIKSARGSTYAICELSWTLRLYMLKDQPVGDTGGRP